MINAIKGIKQWDVIESKCTKDSLRPGAEQGFLEDCTCLRKNIPEGCLRARVRMGISTSIRSPPPQRNGG